MKLGDMPATRKVLQGKADPEDTILTVLKGEGLLQELIPLNSKDRAEYDGKLINEALKHWFVPTDLIR